MTVIAPSDIVGQVTMPVVTDPTVTFATVDSKVADELRGFARSYVASVFTNRTGELDLKAVEQLKTTHHSESYHYIQAQRYSGYIFYEGNKFYEVVTSSGKISGAHSADTIEELILGVNKIYEKD